MSPLMRVGRPVDEITRRGYSSASLLPDSLESVTSSRKQWRIIWSGYLLLGVVLAACVLLFVSCAPVVRCVPDSIYVGCKR